MAEDLLSITCDELPKDTHVVGLKGREGLSELYAFEIGLITKDAAFDQDKAVMARAALEIQLGEEKKPYVHHGVLAQVELLQDFKGQFLYRALLVPKAWQLTLTRHSNVWTDAKIPDVIKDVLEWSGLTEADYEFRINEGSYPKREFIAQYKESNLAFISRWMERLGMFYFFEQTGDREKLIIVDLKSFDDETPNPKVRYVPGSEGDHMALQSFGAFRVRTQALPAAVELWDYDYLKPSLDVRGASPVSKTGIGEIACYGDDNFQSPDVGKKLAGIRAEALLATQKVFYARGRVFGLYAGWPFTLEEHPRGDFADKIYLVTAIEHQSAQSGGDAKMMELLGLDTTSEYRCDITAIRDNVQYRAPDRHPWPRVEGYESGTVCGEGEDKYAQIDDHGRYHVRIMFDEGDLGDGKASAWVRMQQPYGGSTEGWHFPLIKNTEVLLWFMGGDPDRPAIAGVVPNAETPSPVTVNNYTKNVIQTVNQNLIEIEDLLNQQYIYIKCPVENTHIHMGALLFDFNFILNTEGHAHFHFGGLQLIDVDMTLEENVKLDVTFNYQQNWFVNVNVDNKVWVGGNLDLTVDLDAFWIINGSWNAQIVVDNDMRIGGSQYLQIINDQKIDIGGDQTVVIGGDQNITITGKQNIDVQSDWKWNVLGHEIQLKAANSTEITVGLKNEVFIGMKNSVFVGGQINATLAAILDLKAARAMSLTIGQFLNIKAAMELNLTGGPHINIDAGLRVGIHGGVAIGLFAGVKMDLAAGAEIKLDGGPNLELQPIKIQL